MKFVPFLLSGVLTTGLYAGECNVTHHQGDGGSTDAYLGYPATALYLFEDSYLDLSKMSQREPAVQNASGTDTAWVYRSELDSTMMVIVTEKVVKVARVTYSADENTRVDSLFTVKHKDVYKDEFPRLQKAGVFKGTAEQADSLVTHVFELCQRLYSKDFGYAGCVFNPPEQRRRNSGKDIDMVDMPLALAAVAGEFTILLDTLNTCPDLKFTATTAIDTSKTDTTHADTSATDTAATDTSVTDTTVKDTSKTDSISVNPPESLKPGIAKANIFKLGNRRYRIASTMMGSQYRVFSINGQLLKQGTLTSNVFVAPTLPVILILKDGQSIYLKD